MNETEVVHDGALVSHDETAIVEEPAVGSLNLPTPLVPAKLAAVLVGRDHVVAPLGDDRLNAASGQAFPQSVAIVAAVADQPIRVLTRAAWVMCACDRDRVERLVDEENFRRGRRVHVNSERSTRAIAQYHKLRSLAPLGRADARAPFFAGAKVPSMKHSFHWICSRSFSSDRNARQRFNRTPVLDHTERRRQQVVELPYCRGNALQGAPVLRIHRMPSKHFRSSDHGRPPFSEALRAGRCSRINAHCRSVNRRHAIASLLPHKAIDQLLTLPDQGLQRL